MQKKVWDHIQTTEQSRALQRTELHRLYEEQPHYNTTTLQMFSTIEHQVLQYNSHNTDSTLRRLDSS